MVAPNYLIVNADNFGQSLGVNRGIVAAHERGIVTSASLMVCWPAAAEAAAYGRDHPDLSLGLHLDLGEWKYQDGAWVARYERVPMQDAAAVTEEVSAQLASFRRLTGAEPTHLDSHQHVHLREPVRSAVLRIAHQLGVPVRHCTPGIDFCGKFYGQMTDGSPLPEVLSVAGLAGILASLSEGCTELGCHPGLGNDLDTMYRRERNREVDVLCDPATRTSVVAVGCQLISFRHPVVTGQLLCEEVGCAS